MAGKDNKKGAHFQGMWRDSMNLDVINRVESFDS